MTPIQKLQAAIQEFSHSMCESEADAGLVTEALVIWEEVSTGGPERQVIYALTNGGGSLSSAIGLVEIGRAYMMRDLTESIPDGR